MGSPYFAGLCADWKEVSWPSDYDPEKPKAGSKRATATTGAAAVKKLVKTEDIDGSGGGMSATTNRPTVYS